LASPRVGGAALLEARHVATDVAVVGALPLVASCVVAFVSGAWSIRFLVALLRRGRCYAFAPYCWAVGVLTLVYARWLTQGSAACRGTYSRGGGECRRWGCPGVSGP